MIKESKRLKLLMNTADSELVHIEVENNVANFNNSWSDADVKRFLLGLFIFGKNFLNIKRFLENKRMGGNIFDEYHRWSDCKKLKGRKRMTRHKNFSGRKQHELLSCLTHHVLEQFKDAMQQVSKSYSEGRISLEEYITSLKSTVGLGLLAKAIGIGKGKEDLTHPTVEHVKKTQVFSIQTSKAFSSLGPTVWPHLLARGWHSEKLKNQGSLSSKNCVAFLFPGVKKFSRRKLMKGDHYFDSVSDVLSKVIAEPNLLKLEVEDAEIGSDKDGQPDNNHHRYLKHQASTNNGDHMKYAVFYAGLVHRGKSCNLRELKSLHGNSVGKVNVDTDDITYNKGNKHISKTKHKKETARIYSKKNSSNANYQKGKHNRDATGQKEVNANPNDANKTTENHENQKTYVPNGNQPKRIIENQFSQITRSGHSDVAVPPIKRQRLTAWAKAETSHILKNSLGGLGSEKLGLSVILSSIKCQQESR
ncbi:hypothetical protein GmHk_11G032006 [Glycine max]|nr:hypothetical protein GmHk_11G032006 [Glycine max]